MNSQRPTVMVVDDELSIRESFGLILEDKYNVITCASGEASLKKLVDEKVDLIYLDIRMPGMNGMETLKRIKEIDRDVTVIMVTAVNDVQNAGEAIKMGAINYVVKPFDVEKILNMTNLSLKKQAVSSEAREAKREAEAGEERDLVGSSPAIEAIRAIIEEATAKDDNVTISGEPGVEKELIASIIHVGSGRLSGPYLTFTVERGISASLKKKLFGRGSGSFAASLEKEKGLLELAAGGTLYFENIENLPLDVQKELNTALDKKELVREGSSSPIPLNVRIISSTNLALKDAAGKGIFLKELYEKLSIIEINMPPLRKRSSDIAVFAEKLIERFNKIYGKSIKNLTPDCLDTLEGYSFPGNVDELTDIIEEAMLTTGRDMIYCEDLPLNVLTASTTFKDADEGKDFGFETMYGKVEGEYIRSVLRSVSDDRSKAASILGLQPQALSAKLESLGIK